MDTKSLAKSKRAHSLHHHKKHHPNQKVKGATTSSVVPPGTDNKALGKTAVKEKTRAGPIALASNWDRYEDIDDDPMLDNQIDGQASQQGGDAVVPKSKGADYAYLISEAKAQNSTKLSSEIFPSLDDFVSDSGLGKESFFAVRGESLLSSIQNDSFFVDDKEPASYEASFLSLNMHALAEQLAKIDLQKRLFMETDMFLLEQQPQQHFEEIQEREASTTTTTRKPTPNSNPKSVANESKLKAEAAAETELDILLDSFDDVNLKEKQASSSTKKNTLDFDIDGELDDLLKETSTPSLLDASHTQHQSKSGPLDDFDSWLDTI